VHEPGAQFELMVRNACLTSLYAIGSKEPTRVAEQRPHEERVLIGIVRRERARELRLPGDVRGADVLEHGRWRDHDLVTDPALLLDPRHPDQRDVDPAVKSSQALAAAGALPSVSAADATPSIGDADLGAQRERADDRAGEARCAEPGGERRRRGESTLNTSSAPVASSLVVRQRAEQEGFAREDTTSNVRGSTPTRSAKPTRLTALPPCASVGPPMCEIRPLTKS